MRVCRSLALATMTILGAASATGATDVREETVRFARGTSGSTIQGSIKDYESVRYSVDVKAGQKMSVQLDTSSTSNYLNITAPGASETLFNGSIKGNGTSFVIPSSGNYVIDVYLMRNAARREETANYTLTIYVE
jgi:hypothetical protein